MCPLAPVPPPANIGLYWTDEEIFTSLERLTKGSSIPENVLIDVNPYQHSPSNLPEDFWYFMRAEQKKDSEHGSWNARGEANQIFGNSSITGWRTTLEFYDHGQRTDWVMQEYHINPKGHRSNGNSKVSGLLCRVFLSGPNPEVRRKLGGLENSEGNRLHPRSSSLLIQEPGSTTGQGSTSESQARGRDDNMRPLAENGGHVDILIENMFDMGDYLELDDLPDGESRSSSSDNTSCVTISSEECFDSLALLQDIEEDEFNRQEQGKDANFKFSVAASARPTEVVIRPANLGSLISSNGRQPPDGYADKKVPEKMDLKNAIKIQKVESRNVGTSNSRNVASSSSSHKAVPEGEEDARVKKMKKLRNKYLCFMPF
ncbi:NAC domain-containing protein 4-like [Rhododendron vialii]|uniref:NAC domain-containing protein 4-like n=1 Tax=Rhododendron vialii TaxID=182163 RepID=UPI00266054EE|nr:NAC domain-containing protein 4-like [Rhododendron vialii]